jgi:hypothetical protein
VAAPGVKLQFSVLDYNVGGGAVRFIGDPVVEDVPANGTKEFKLKEAWVPGKEGHYCIAAEIDVYAVPGVLPVVTELSGENNRAQSNYTLIISKSSSPVTRERTTVTVENPFSEPTTVAIHAVQSSPLYRSFFSARSLELRPREVRQIEVLVEYGTDEQDTPVTADEREAYIGRPNNLSIWSSARQPGENRMPAVLLGGASLVALTGRATRFSEFIHEGPYMMGRIVAVDDGKAVPGGFAIVTTVGASGRLESSSGPVSAYGWFKVPIRPGSVRAWADYVPADGFGDCAQPEISIGLH